MAEKLRLGGMALRNGLLVHGPTHWAAAVRRSDGTIAATSGRKPRLKGFDKVAGVRGVIRLGEAMVVIPLVKRALPEAKLPFQDARVLGTMAAAAAGGRILRGQMKGGAGTETLLAAVSLLPSFVALRGGELAEYHGVEHKAIAAYETDAGDAADAAKEHDRCGSHLMAPLLASNLAGAALLRHTLDRPGTGRPDGGRPGLARASPSRSSSGPSAMPRRRPPRACCAGRGTSCSGCSGRASRRRRSSRSGAPRSPRSCASRRHRRRLSSA